MSLALLDQDWRAEALCARFDPDLFFAPGAIEHKEALFEPANSKVYRHPTFFPMPDEVKHI